MAINVTAVVEQRVMHPDDIGWMCVRFLKLKASVQTAIEDIGRSQA